VAITHTPMTELEAVNSMLAIIGELPVSSLINPGVTQASIARDILHRVNREVQSWQLACNTEREFPLLPDTDGKVAVPTNAIFVDPTYPYEDYVIRGMYLYNRVKHTFIISNTVKADITFFLPFEDLPQHVRAYVAIRAAREFQARYLGSGDVHDLTAKDEQEALVVMKRMEMRKKDHKFTDSTHVANIARRNYV
jgi:hypothetical protein